MQGTSHTFNITNIVGSLGGNYSQGPTPALNYNTYSIAVTAPTAQGVSYSSETSGTVVCPVVGNIFSGGGLFDVL